MKRILYGVLAALVVMLLPFQPVSAQKKQIEVKGKVDLLNPATFSAYNMVWLYSGLGRDVKLVDSAQVGADGRFSLRVPRDQNTLYRLDILKWQEASFWGDADVEIAARGYDTARMKSKNSGPLTVHSASPATQLIQTAAYFQQLAQEERKLLETEFIAAQRNLRNDSTWATFLRDQGVSRKKTAIEDQRLQFMIEQNITNPGTLYMLGMLNSERQSKFLDSMLQVYSRHHPKIAAAKAYSAQLDAQKQRSIAVGPGSVFPAMSYTDPDGQIVEWASLKGKVVLVDFWASWCGPCRKSFPKLKELYEEFQGQGLEILGVSVDTSNEAWLKALREEQLPWPQVLSPDKDKTLSQYMVQGIPTLFVLDREGKIIKRYTGFSPDLKETIAAAVSR